MLSDADRAAVAAAVTRAEAASDGEIVTVVAPSSDDYRDVVLRWAIVIMFVAVAIVALVPAAAVALFDRVAGGWSGWTAGELVAALMLPMAAALLLGRLVVGVPTLRRAIVPSGTRARRVRARALLLFRLTVESRTRARTGVLIYLSLAERRAEIVADQSIAALVPAETWGAAMAALLDGVRRGAAGAGMIAAVGQVGDVLARHFPRSADDTNELPDRLILL